MTKTKFFPTTIRTFGSSMYPMLVDQDVVYLQKVKFENIEVTDVLCVKKKGKMFTHRVIYKTSKFLITKGDATLQSDGKIFPKNVIGKVSKIERNNQVLSLSDLYLFQATVYFDEVKKLARKFKEYKVEYLILKGIPHDLYYSRKHPSKIYADCDILITSKDKTKADKILRELQYLTESQLKYSYLQRYIGAEVKEVTYYRKLNNFIIRFDVHYEINVFSHITKLPFPFLQKISDSFTKDLIKNKQLIEINGTWLPMLKYEDLIVYLLLHTFGHGYTGALRFEALKDLLNNHSLEINKYISTALEKANNYKLIKFITPPLYLLHKYYNVYEPYELLKQRFPSKVRSSMAVYNLLSGKESMFDDMTATYSTRFRRAIFLVLYSEANPISKMYYALQPKLILHLIFFVLVYLETRVRKRSFLEPV